MFSIAPIGSCRTSTPLRLGQDDYGYALNKSRNYGYCHSPAEAVQMARFLLGKSKLPKELWPLIARGVDYDATHKTKHMKADLYIVELSSAKEISIDGICVQLNYLTAAYRSFFENNARARHFWEHAAEGDQIAIDINLSGAQLDAEDTALLRRIRLNLVTEESLAANVALLRQMLPNVMFVTHVNARQSDGTMLQTRDNFIGMVKRVICEAGGQVFDPTKLMEQVGQRAAIADHSEGLAHFTEDFARSLVGEWHRAAIAPVLDRLVAEGDEDAAVRLLVPHAKALIARGKAASLQARLDVLQERRPDLKVVNRLSYMASVAQSDEAASYARLKELLALEPNDLPTLRALRDAAIELRRFDTALECIEALAAKGQLMPPRQLVHLGQEALAGAKIAVAITLFQSAFLQSGKTRKAARLFAQTALDHAPAVLDTLPAKEKARLLSHLEPDVQLRVLVHLQVVDPEESVDLAALSARELSSLTRQLSDRSEIPRAAALIQRWLIEHEAQDRVPTSLRAVIDGWLARATDQTALTDAIALLVSARSAAESYGPTHRALRTLRKSILVRMKAIVTAGDAVALDHLANEVAQFPLPLPELSLARARMAFVAGDHEKALRFGQEVATVWADNISVWVLMMRAASKLDDMVTMAHAAERVLALSDPSTQRLEDEAQDQLRRIKAA